MPGSRLTDLFTGLTELSAWSPWPPLTDATPPAFVFTVETAPIRNPDAPYSGDDMLLAASLSTRFMRQLRARVAAGRPPPPYTSRCPRAS